MNEQQEIVRKRMRRIKELSGWSWSLIAKKAELSPSTLTRFMNKSNVTHVLSTTTLAKIEALFRQQVNLANRENPEMLIALGKRLLFVRTVMAPTLSDEDIASHIGWSLIEMGAIFAGLEAITLEKLWIFATRMNVTTDFLLYESLEGLPKVSERMLLAADPNLGLPLKGKGPDKGKDQP